MQRRRMPQLKMEGRKSVFVSIQQQSTVTNQRSNHTKTKRIAWKPVQRVDGAENQKISRDEICVRKGTVLVDGTRESVNDSVDTERQHVGGYICGSGTVSNDNERALQQGTDTVG